MIMSDQCQFEWPGIWIRGELFHRDNERRVSNYFRLLYTSFYIFYPPPRPSSLENINGGAF